MLMMKKVRNEQGKSQAQVARDGDMHSTSVSMIEGGRLKPGKIQAEKIAKALQWEKDPALLFEEVEA